MTPEQWLDEVYGLLQRVSEHFEDTDAPLGRDALRLLATAPDFEGVG